MILSVLKWAAVALGVIALLAFVGIIAGVASALIMFTFHGDGDELNSDDYEA